jgi:ABC-type antimicrobial peptide transport system permease subunit
MQPRLVARRCFALAVRSRFARLTANAWVVTRLLKSFLFGVSEHDPVTVISASLLLIVCGLIAAIGPARRAASIDPMKALRTE